MARVRECPLEEPTVKITDKAEVECSGLEPGTKYFVRARRGESSLLTPRGAPLLCHVSICLLTSRAAPMA